MLLRKKESSLIVLWHLGVMAQTRKSKKSGWESESPCSRGRGNVGTEGGILRKAKNREALGPVCCWETGHVCSEIDLVGFISRETVVTWVLRYMKRRQAGRESWGLTWRREFPPCLLIFGAWILFTTWTFQILLNPLPIKYIRFLRLYIKMPLEFGLMVR